MSEVKESSGFVFLISLMVALRTRAVWGHCYENAYHAFFAFPELFLPDGKFVEGWAVFVDSERVILMEHGWLVSGAVNIDPTLVLELTPDQTVFFYPGVIRSWLETDMLENELFPHVRFSGYGDDGMEHPGYKAAYLAAKQKAQSLMSDTHELIEVRAADPPAEQVQIEEDPVEIVFVSIPNGNEDSLS